MSFCYRNENKVPNWLLDHEEYILVPGEDGGMTSAKEGGGMKLRLFQALLSGKQRLGQGAGLGFRRNKTRNKRLTQRCMID